VIFTKGIGKSIFYLVPKLRPVSKSEEISYIVEYYSICSFLLYIILPIITSGRSEINQGWYNIINRTIVYNIFLSCIMSIASAIYTPLGYKFITEKLASYIASEQIDLENIYAGPSF